MEFEGTPDESLIRQEVLGCTEATPRLSGRGQSEEPPYAQLKAEARTATKTELRDVWSAVQRASIRAATVSLGISLALGSLGATMPQIATAAKALGIYTVVWTALDARKYAFSIAQNYLISKKLRSRKESIKSLLFSRQQTEEGLAWGVRLKKRFFAGVCGTALTLACSLPIGAFTAGSTVLGKVCVDMLRGKTMLVSPQDVVAPATSSSAPDLR